MSRSMMCIGRPIYYTQGDLSDKESLVKAIQHVDVVISTVGLSQFMNQINIISAIKESGKHIKVSIFISRL